MDTEAKIHTSPACTSESNAKVTSGDCISLGLLSLALNSLLQCKYCNKYVCLEYFEVSMKRQVAVARWVLVCTNCSP